MSTAQAGTRIDGWAGHLHGPLRWTCRLAVVNLLWIAGTGAGLVIAGFAPATVSGCYLLREYHLGRSPRAWHDFWRVWRAELLTSQPRLGLPSATAAVAIFYTAWAANTPGWFPLALALGILTALYLATLCFLPAVLAHVITRPAVAWRLAAMVAWRRPVITLAVTGANAALLTLMGMAFPAALPLFAFSLPAYLVCLVAHRGLDHLTHPKEPS